MKKILIGLFLACLIFTACSPSGSSENQEVKTSEGKDKGIENKDKKNDKSKDKGEKMTLKQFEAFEDGQVKATIKTNMGDIGVVLYPEAAPMAVDNFVKLSEKGYYKGVIFHRVIKDFMIQGGDPTGTGSGGQSAFGKNFKDEFNKGYRNFYGALSMANAGPDTNGSQFFIVTAKSVPDDLVGQMEEVGGETFPKAVIEKYKEVGGTPWLDFRHTVFGQVVKGMDVVLKIQDVKTGEMDKPLEDVKIEDIIIEK